MESVKPFDCMYLVLFALALPLYDALVGWPGYARRVKADPAKARVWLWRTSTVYAWVLVGVGAAWWMYAERPWAWLKFTMPEGWRLLVAVAIVVAYSAYQVLGIQQVARDPALRERLRASMGSGVANVVPHTRANLRLFAIVSITAGFCEEFLYRGYFIWVLAPWLGWWGAAALSTVCFAIGHAYQGWRGVATTGVFGAIYVSIVALTISLWPAIALHVVVDATNGVMAWVILRDRRKVI